MANEQSLQRFLDAQGHTYQRALTEIKAECKQSHWMWFIFPQIRGLGFSETSVFYAVQHAAEAAAYLAHPILGKRLVEISKVLLSLTQSDPKKIFGSPDNMKLQSSMTLFGALPGADPVFQAVLQKFFNGIKDQRTLNILKILN